MVYLEIEIADNLPKARSILAAEPAYYVAGTCGNRAGGRCHRRKYRLPDAGTERWRPSARRHLCRHRYRRLTEDRSRSRAPAVRRAWSPTKGGSARPAARTSWPPRKYTIAFDPAPAPTEKNAFHPWQSRSRLRPPLSTTAGTPCFCATRTRRPRGKSEILDCGDTACCLIRRTHAGESVIIALNIGRAGRALPFDSEAHGYASPTGALVAGEGEATFTRSSGADTRSLPACSIAILRQRNNPRKRDKEERPSFANATIGK